ncbi:MAG TPA: serine/threonine-protein kinase [Solirubrobacterales bacterium]|nr:serine/threonine-protein kinase [Solirubrobacterales bacterium]
MEPGNPRVDLSAGEEFAGYRIERRLGRGGMGVLYLATEPGLERHVALKLIAPEAAADEVFARRFAEESRIAASIEHPNVVPIYAAGEEGGIPFIAMRYVSGSDLGRRLAREGRLDPTIAAALIAQVGNGLDAIHAAGLVHRDVKPANVLLGGAGPADHAYITDFGVARNVATESGLTQTGRFVGTLDYVAPEQISGGTVDARADVYALGCLLFKLLTGDVPYPRDGEAARLYAHLNDPPPAPSLQATAVPMALDDVVIRAMSKAPEDRYPSAGDLGRAALAALSGSRPDLPERTVATGAAATRAAETIAPAPQAAEGTTAATGRIGPGRTGGSRRRIGLALASGLLVAAAILVAVLAFGGGGGDPQAGVPSTESSPKRHPQKQASPALSRSELIAKADAICADSQNAFKQVKGEFPEASAEEVADVPYSEALVGISTPAVKRFGKLVAPVSVRQPFERYVQAQQRVHRYDVQALRAARAGHEDEYRAARERRDNEQPERHRLAAEIGLRVCSVSPA